MKLEDIKKGMIVYYTYPWQTDTKTRGIVTREKHRNLKKFVVTIKWGDDGKKTYEGEKEINNTLFDWKTGQYQNDFDELLNDKKGENKMNRIRYTEENNVSVSKPIVFQDKSYVVKLYTLSNEFEVVDSETSVAVVRGTGKNLVELKKNARLTLETLGVVFTKETRKRKVTTKEDYRIVEATPKVA